MRLRVAVLILPLALGLLAAPLPAEAQVRRIGVLTVVPSATPRTEAFRAGLRELGYVEGRNLVIHWQWAAGKLERFPELASELKRLKVEVIVAAGPVAIAAAKNATSTIPVVMVAAADPVRSGLVKSLARPGGKITGLSYDVTPEVEAKALELLTEAVSSVAKVGMLWNSAEPGITPFAEAIEAGARMLGIAIKSHDIRTAKDVETAFVVMREEDVGGVVVVPGMLTYVHRQRIVDLAAKNRLPAIYGFEDITQAGGLMSYGPSLAGMYRRAAVYVDKILRGADPSDLPVERPTKFELWVNQKTAKALGLTIPPSVLIRADKVIE